MGQAFSNNSPSYNSNTASLPDGNTGMVVETAANALVGGDMSNNCKKRNRDIIDFTTSHPRNGPATIPTRDLKSKHHTPNSPSPSAAAAPVHAPMSNRTVGAANGTNALHSAVRSAAGSANGTGAGAVGRLPTMHMPGERSHLLSGRVALDVKMEDRPQPTTQGPSSSPQPMDLSTLTPPAAGTTNNATGLAADSESNLAHEPYIFDPATYPDASLDADIPHWDGPYVKMSNKSLLDKARQKKLRRFHARNMRSLAVAITKKIPCECPNNECETDLGQTFLSDTERPYRPSDIVRGEDESSAEEYSGIYKKRHRRRKTASAIRTKRTSGIRANQFELEGYRLKGYGELLVPPTADRKIRRNTPYSRYLYRNSVADARKKKRCKWKKLADAQVEPEADYSSPASAGGNERDADYFECSDTFHIDRTGGEYMGYTLVEVVEPVKKNKKTRTTIMTQGNELITKNDLARPKKQRIETKVLNEFYQMLTHNPEGLYKDIRERERKKREDNQPIDVDNQQTEVVDVDKIVKADKKDDDDDVKSMNSDSSEDEQTMRVFDRMKRDASKHFYKVRSTRKGNFPISSDLDSDGSTHEEQLLAIEEQEGMRNGMNLKKMFGKANERMMSKWNFTGRLGRNETGITVPITGHPLLYGAGIGHPAKARKGDALPPSSPRMVHNPRRTSASRPSSTSPSNTRSKKRKRAAGTTCSHNHSHSSAQRTKRVTFDWKCTLEDRVSYLDVEPRQKIPGDNGRRAILIDFDTLFTNAHARRMAAFRKMIVDCDELSDISPFKPMIFSKYGDRCDRECIEALLEANKIPKSKAKVDRFLALLDAAFSAGQELVPNAKIANKLRDAAKNARLGIFHYGSARRMKAEFERFEDRMEMDIGLSRMVVPNTVVSVKDGDVAPYIESWRELYLHIGVTPSQSLLMLSDHALNRVNSGVIVASALGARSLICIAGEKPKGFKTTVFQAKIALTHSQLAKGLSFKRVMANPLDIDVGPKRVLAHREKKGLWNSATELYRSNSHDRKVLVRFDEDGELSWIAAKDTRHLSQEDYLKIKDNDFCDLFDPDDVDTLTFNNNYVKKRAKVVPIVELD